jgi:hypothetical protein
MTFQEVIAQPHYLTEQGKAYLEGSDLGQKLILSDKYFYLTTPSF